MLSKRIPQCGKTRKGRDAQEEQVAVDPLAIRHA